MEKERVVGIDSKHPLHEAVPILASWALPTFGKLIEAQYARRKGRAPLIVVAGAMIKAYSELQFILLVVTNYSLNTINLFRVIRQYPHLSSKHMKQEALRRSPHTQILLSPDNFDASSEYCFLVARSTMISPGILQ